MTHVVIKLFCVSRWFPAWGSEPIMGMKINWRDCHMIKGALCRFFLQTNKQRYQCLHLYFLRP